MADDTEDQLTPMQRLKQQHPEYEQLSDTDLADRMYDKLYAGKIGKDEYYQKIGIEAPSATKEILPATGYGLRQGVVDVLGTPGAVEELVDAGMNAADAYVRDKLGMAPADYEKMRKDAGVDKWHLPTPNDINKFFGWEDYKPRTTTGKYVKSVAEMVPSFAFPEEAAATKLTSATRGGVTSAFKAAGTKTAVPAKRGAELLTENLGGRAAGAAAAGVGAETAGELTDDNPLARAIGGGVGGLGAGAVGVARTTAENRAFLQSSKAAAQKSYDFLATSTHPIAPLDLEMLGNTVEVNLHQQGYRDVTAPRTYSIVRGELKAPSGGVTQVHPSGAVTTQYPGQVQRRVQDLVATHEALGRIKPSAESMTDYEAAQEARAGIRNFLETLPDKRIGKEHRNALANWAQHAKERDILDAIEKAENRAASTGRGLNYQNTIRQEVKKILQERVKRGGLFKDEEAAMRQITRGNHFENVVRVLSSFAPLDLHRAFFSLAAHAVGGLALSGTLAGVGGAMHLLAKVLNKRDLNRLIDTLREKAPANLRRTPVAKRAAQRARNALLAGATRGAVIGEEGGEVRQAPARITVHPAGSAQEATPDLPHEASNLEDDGGDLGAFTTRGLSGVAERHGIDIPGTSTMRPIAQAAGELPMGGAFSGKEMALLRQLVMQKVPWREIAKQFPGRRLEALQMQAYRTMKDMPQRAAGPRRPGFEERPPPGMEPGWSRGVLDQLDNPGAE